MNVYKTLTIAHIFRLQKEKKNMTYAMLHEKSGLSVSTIGNILNVRENSCRTDTLDLLADALDIDDWHSLACSFAEKTYHVRWYGSLRPDVINGQTDYLGSVTGYCINAKNESEAIDAFLEFEFDNAYKMRKEKPDYYDVICDEALSGYLGSATMIAELPNMVDDETYKIMSEYKSRLAIINKNMSFEERNNTFKGILQSNEIKKIWKYWARREVFIEETTFRNAIKY